MPNYQHQIDRVEQSLRKFAEDVEIEATAELITDLGKIADELEQRLRSENPHLAEYLDSMYIVRSLWQYGFEVAGEIYPDEATANEARRAAVMHQLIKMKREVS